MDFGLREWLIIIGIIVIGAIAVDGWRRMRGDKRGLRLKPDHFGSPDMPPPHQEPVLQPSMPNEPIDLGPRPRPCPQTGPARPPRGPDLINDTRRPRNSDPLCPLYRAHQQVAEPESMPVEPQATAPQPEPAPLVQERASMITRAEPLLDEPEPVLQAVEPEPEPQEVREVPQQDVLIVNVRARAEAGFDGRSLLHIILQGGMRFGDMDIFHRHESMTGTGEVLYSMANGVRPGYFELNSIDDFHTPLVSFFLRVPGPANPRQAFDMMVACARMVSTKLDGELLDERHQPITAQTFEQYRQRIQAFDAR